MYTFTISFNIILEVLVNSLRHRKEKKQKKNINIGKETNIDKMFIQKTHSLIKMTVSAENPKVSYKISTRNKK